MEFITIPIMISCLLGYLFGSFQSSYIIGKIFHKLDIREHGTFNAGASNAMMILGVKKGIIVFLLDVYKVVLVMELTKIILGANYFNHYYAGLSAVLGHNFPFYLKFKGGKGVASFIGLFVGIKMLLGYLLGITFFCFAIVINYISLAGIFLYLIGPILIYQITLNINITIYTAIVGIIGIFLHRKNIPNIRQGKEKKVREFILDKVLKRD